MLRNICWSRVDLNPANASTTDADGGTGVVKTVFSAYVRSTTFPCQLRALPHGENILIVEIMLSSSSSYTKIPFIGSFTESCTTASCGVGWHRVARNMLQYEKGFLHPETPTKITRQIVSDRGHPLRLKNLFFCLSLLRCHPNLTTRGSHKTKEFEAPSTTTLQSRVQLWVFLVRYWSSDSEIARVFPVFK